jgi:peroxiredoxin
MALPRISLPATIGAEVCLADEPGLSVLIVYPWAGGPGLPNPPHWDGIPGAHGSTPELEGFRDLAADFARLKVKLLGLSQQTTDYQHEMAERLSLPFPVLRDNEGRMASALALPTSTTGGEIYLNRLTLIVRAGVIEAVFYPVPNPASHAGDVLRWFCREIPIARS